MKRVLAIAALVSVFASCNNSPKLEKTESGMTYKIFKGDGKEKFKQGDIIKFDVLVKISPKDTVWFTTYNRLPQYVPFDTAAKNTGDFTELLKLASIGDSIVTMMSVDSMVKRNMAQYNDILKRGDQIVTQVKLLKVFAKEEDVTKDQKEAFEKRKVSEVAELGNYLKSKGIKAEKTENGVYVELKNTGAGPLVTDGKQVTVDYTGYLIENGKPFDSNVDSAIGAVRPFSFVVGRDPIIAGWAEGLKKFAEGSSGTLYIPSSLGYGPRGSAPVIPAFANLKFDVLVKKIADAPPPPSKPAGMPTQDANGQNAPK